ncbi:ATP-dependent Clp protease ATP-binding subunit [Eubacterium coprostanoligenes]|uniref:ATP-dependent Clp protease ATP-binding subunit n=1 Tax=Eubacterium coprostanoligenes TaxID=290054 RepID=UPI0023552218|nr:ATP-dependent Clp protease ATP-binding subunit [Eubacterium coprostanoligenes]MCI6254541.1 ATP-dependent Clp protease ATP-binding subunit [Eubacterium coprostanoligenes]MDD7358419.1 ATP-dependent Clp protease ATP-binding subunit [Eubacterium coprostanoligenes]MDY5400733.1 ATP-dependent Clp protease ATP-binding subunit [Eubacterium coprostanoligenes]
MYRFNSFTTKANEVLNLAIKSAQAYGHNYIGTEHILIGLLSTDSTIPALTNNNITYEGVDRLIREEIGVGNPTSLTPDDFTPRAKRIIEISFQIARTMRNSYVSVEHLLAALLKEDDSYAVKFINELGTDSQRVFDDLISDLSSNSYDSNPQSSSKKKGKSKTPTLDEFGKNLTELAKQGKIDPVIGREKEIERVIQILSRRNKNNPCLIGEPGVGKTAIAEGLALKIVNGEVPEMLANKTIYSLDLTSMVAGTKYRGDFEERIKKAMDEVKDNKDVILFIDEIHNIMGAGAAEGAVDAANILKPSLARGEIQVIGATTISEYRKNIEKDAALERRFQPVTVGEPTEEETVEILKGLRDKYEAHHKVKITDDAINSAVKLSSRYINDRFLPDKAIDLIDEAASVVRLNAYTLPQNLKDMEEEIKRLNAEKQDAVNNQKFEEAAKIRDKANELKKLLDDERSKWRNSSNHDVKAVSSEEIAQVVSQWTGVPVNQLTKEESERLLNMEKILHERIVGQDKAVSTISKAIRRGRVGLKNPNRPIGSFIFLGPTGVGKTELCKSLAEAMFGDENAIIKLDMSEYMEKHTVSKLIGAPPGYVGFDEGGQLTEKIRRKPYSVVLFDEIEKAHPDVFNMLLQILEDGVLTDSQGRKVSFKNAIIIMTSNVGASKITDEKLALGFVQEDGKKLSIEDLVMPDLKKTFKPEFLNRLDDIIVFNQLDQNDIEEIAKRMLKSLKKRTADLGIELDFTDNAITELAKEGFDKTYGARPLRRAIQSKIEDRLSELILDKTIGEGSKCTVDFSDGEFQFNS